RAAGAARRPRGRQHDRAPRGWCRRRAAWEPSMIFVLRMAVRETCASWRLLFFFICIAVGVAAIVALRSVIQSVRAVVNTEARALVGADVVMSTNREWPPD